MFAQKLSCALLVRTFAKKKIGVAGSHPGAVISRSVRATNLLPGMGETLAIPKPEATKPFQQLFVLFQKRARSDVVGMGEREHLCHQRDWIQCALAVHTEADYANR